MRILNFDSGSSPALLMHKEHDFWYEKNNDSGKQGDGSKTPMEQTQDGLGQGEDDDAQNRKEATKPNKEASDPHEKGNKAKSQGTTTVPNAASGTSKEPEKKVMAIMITKKLQQVIQMMIVLQNGTKYGSKIQLQLNLTLQAFLNI